MCLYYCSLCANNACFRATTAHAYISCFNQVFAYHTMVVLELCSDACGESLAATVAVCTSCCCHRGNHGMHSLLLRYKSSIGVKELMHFFHSTHTSVNAVSTASSASPPNSTPSTPGAAATPLAPSTPSRFDALGNLPRSVGRSRPALRNFCKHGQREALRRASCKRPRASSQEAFGRKRGRADETTSEANRMTVVTATGLAATPDLLQGDSEVQATATTNEQTNASCFAALESSAEVTHVSTSGCIMLNQGTAQTSDQPTPKQPQIDIQLPSPALHKVPSQSCCGKGMWGFHAAYAPALLKCCAPAIIQKACYLAERPRAYCMSNPLVALITDVR